VIERILHVLDAINAQIGQPTAVRAILVGFVFSIGLTQLAKFSAAFDRLPRPQHRAATRAVAFCFAASATWLLWPDRGMAGPVIGVALGLIAPAAYTLTARILVHFWPWLDPVISARPDPKREP
jgi:hypothetical protein